MVAIKTGQAQSFLRAPDPAVRAFLFYGTDAGMVTERSLHVAQTLAQRDDPPGEILRIDDETLAEDPDRLAVELQVLPMFGGRKVVRAIAGRRIDGRSLAPLIEGAALENYLIVEAGNLTQASDLRKLFEEQQYTAAIACYADETRDLSGLVQDVLLAHGMGIDAQTRDLLVARLGADRALSRNEIEKLALYAQGAKTITAEHVEAIVGDASEIALDRIIYPTANGNAAAAIRNLGRADAAGESPQVLILMLQRHFQRLHRVRAAMDQGQPLDQVVKFLRPPIHFKQASTFQAQCKAWDLPRLERAMATIEKAARDARLAGAMELTVTERLVMDVAALLPRAAGRG